MLTDVHLTAAPGEVVALLGPSGSGKSTLLRVVAGLTVPDSGAVRIDGIDVTAVATHRRDVGMVFQDEQLFSNMDVEANIAFGLRMHDVAPATTRARVVELLALVGLDELRTAGGDDPERRRGEAGGGRPSLAPRPRVLLLDEPLTGLDRELHDRLAADLAPDHARRAHDGRAGDPRPRRGGSHRRPRR